MIEKLKMAFQGHLGEAGNHGLYDTYSEKMRGEKEASLQAEINVGRTNFGYLLGGVFHKSVIHLPIPPRMLPTTSARMVSWWFSSGVLGSTGKGSDLSVVRVSMGSKVRAEGPFVHIWII